MRLRDIFPPVVKEFLIALRDANFSQPSHSEPYGFVSESGVPTLYHDAGFFNNCTVALRELARSRFPVVEIDASMVFRFYTGRFKSAHWETFFASVIPGVVREFGEWEVDLAHHSLYDELDLSAVTPLVCSYFRPSKKVAGIIQEVLRKYQINLSRTIAVHYRGTDKFTEVDPVPVSEWISAIDSELAQVPEDFRILVQTDELPVRQQLVSHYGSRAFFFDEIPATNESIAVHHLVRPRHRVAFGRHILAATILISNCSRVVTHTGNGGLWVALYRGSTQGLEQMYSQDSR